MDLESEELRRRYRIGRAGFGFIALGVGFLCLNASAYLAFFLSREMDILNLIESPLWNWLVGAPITGGTVLGTFLIFGCWPDSSWRRRAGALVVMHLIDVALWTLSNGEELGLDFGEIGHEWFRSQLAEGMGWLEFLLFIGLANDLIGRSGHAKGLQTGRGARLVSSVGFAFWLVVFFDQTDWDRQWPLVRLPLNNAKAVLLLLGSTILLAIAAFQVTAVCLTACRYSRRALADLATDEDPDELLRSRSESSDDHPNHWWDRRADDPWR